MKAYKGRGAVSNQRQRFIPLHSVFESGTEPDNVTTDYFDEQAGTIIARNDSPDVPFEQSINPYRGCEHGCIYCFARPTHSYLDFSAGLDFESKIVCKRNAAIKLHEAMMRPSYKVKTLALGSNTDPYQPVERRLGITRSVLEVLQLFRHPVAIVTKGALIERDIDILADLARDNLVSVMVSVTTLDNGLKRRLEPRTPAGLTRLKTIEKLARAGIPVGVLAAPMIPVINDRELEDIVAMAADYGADRAAYILLRLPHEVSQLFEEWLQTHYPSKAKHCLSIISQCRSGRLNSAQYGERMSGTGPFAELLRQRFHSACVRYGLNSGERLELNTQAFARPQQQEPQMSLSL